jgi:hypothetical protein
MSFLLGRRLRGFVDTGLVILDMRWACLMARLSFLEAGNNDSACCVRASDFLSMDFEGLAAFSGRERRGAYVSCQKRTAVCFCTYHIQRNRPGESGPRFFRFWG